MSTEFIPSRAVLTIQLLISFMCELATQQTSFSIGIRIFHKKNVLTQQVVRYFHFRISVSQYFFCDFQLMLL